MFAFDLQVVMESQKMIPLVFKYNLGKLHESLYVFKTINIINAMDTLISSWRYRECSAGIIRILDIGFILCTYYSIIARISVNDLNLGKLRSNNFFWPHSIVIVILNGIVIQQDTNISRARV